MRRALLLIEVDVLPERDRDHVIELLTAVGEHATVLADGEVVRIGVWDPDREAPPPLQIVRQEPEGPAS